MIGLGYIGLPTAAVMASRGLNVVGVDTNPRVINIINEGSIHIVEPELEALVHEVVRAGRLKAVSIPTASDAYLIAVPTPFKGDHEPDMSYVEAAAKSIAPCLKKGNLVVLESTSPVGSTERLALWLAEARPDLKFPGAESDDADVCVAYCPERVLPGKVLHELVINDRVIGGISKKCTERAIALYNIFVQGECIPTNVRTAELCKLTENSFRDVNIAFANELSIICDRLSVDVWDVISLANRHPRVKVLQPGPGVGGHCIAVDPWFIVHSAPDVARLIKCAREVNDQKPDWVVGEVKAAAARFERPTIGCLGLTFKENIDDVRESPALEIVRKIVASNIGSVLVFDPYVATNSTEFVIDDFDHVIERADVIVLLVAHKEFGQIERDRLKGKVLVDTRGVWR